MRIVYLPTADRDLVEIYEWIGVADVAAAGRYIDRIRNALWRLRDFPRSGPARDDIVVGVRSVVIGSHIALYRVTDSAVEIVRIVHGSRDLLTFADDFS